MIKEVQEGEQNNSIIAQVLRDEIYRAMRRRNPTAEEILSEVLA